jgi:Fe-S cluster biogenesis protein NfuA
MSGADLPSDQFPFYTDEELDALYERDPLLAMRLSRRQAELDRLAGESAVADPSLPAPSIEELTELIGQARAILRRDGGDLELIGIEGDIVTVRMTGNCAGCPRAALDAKNVVERLVRSRFPRIKAVKRVVGASR